MAATFLDFYKIDLTTIVIIFLISIGLFILINYNDDKKEENYTFNIIISIVAGVLASVLYSYLTLEADEIMTSNYWE